MIANATVPASLGGERSTSFHQHLALGPQEKDPWNAPRIPLGSTAEPSSSTSKATPSTTPEVVSKTASGMIAPTALGGLPASEQGAGPYFTQKAAPSEAVNNKSYPEVPTPSIHKGHFSTDPEKVSTLTMPAPGEKGTPTSSTLEKEIDLEAGHRGDDADKKEPDTNKTEVDPNIVDWDGPDDPQNPINWSEKLKWANVAVIASITFIT